MRWENLVCTPDFFIKNASNAFMCTIAQKPWLNILCYSNNINTLHVRSTYYAHGFSFSFGISLLPHERKASRIGFGSKSLEIHEFWFWNLHLMFTLLILKNTLAKHLWFAVANTCIHPFVSEECDDVTLILLIISVCLNCGGFIEKQRTISHLDYVCAPLETLCLADSHKTHSMIVTDELTTLLNNKSTQRKRATEHTTSTTLSRSISCACNREMACGVGTLNHIQGQMNQSNT